MNFKLLKKQGPILPIGKFVIKKTKILYFLGLK